MLQVGIVGLPNAGKSTLFNALAKAHATVAGHPFTTVEPNVGVAMVPDARLEALVEVLGPERAVPAHVRFVDIAGLVRGAHLGEGLGNRFLAHVRETDAVLLLLRAFASDTVPHPEAEVDPTRDLEVLTTELILADLETATRAAEKSERRAAGTRVDAERDRAGALKRAVAALERGGNLRAELSHDDLGRIRDAFLLTAKPFLYVVNVGEEDLDGEEAMLARVRAVVPPGSEVLAVCAKLEEEVEDLPDDEAQALLKEFGVEVRGTARIAEAARRLLGLITFYSIESSECRAWLVPEGTTAVAAAADIHTDMARGFVKAEVVRAEDLVEAGSVAHARERGFVKLEGRDYIVHDGDVLTFRFRA
ncbi:MAG TPA: redox-regulated ATPase YchF [Actinomycetota bacterium]|nr:redox-regulated ATPase YchF [Actinomycetota bacterium]